MENGWILIFDSGVGGLTILHRMLQMYPNENFYYYADVANVPYGNKDKDEVQDLILKAIASVNQRYNLKSIVIACNTATSVAIQSLRNLYSIPIIGMEPAIKPGISQLTNGSICVMATALTLQEEKFQNLIKNLNVDDKVVSIAMPELVEAAEEFDFNSPKLVATIKRKLSSINWSQIEVLVLGCTHFIYFSKLLSFLLPDHVKIIDGNEGTIRQISNKLTHFNRATGQVITSLSGKEIDNELIKPYLDFLDKLKSQ